MSHQSAGHYPGSSGVRIYMHKRMRLALWFIAAIAMGAFVWFIWILSWDSEEKAIYRVALEQIHGSDGVAQFVVSDQTFSWERFGFSHFHAKKLCLPTSMTLDYAVRNVLRRKLPNHLAASRPIVLLSVTYVEKILASSTPNDGETRRIRKLIGNSYGMVTLSRVGFNLPHTRAVIYVQLIYCGLCGGGYYYYLEKEDGVWKITKLAGTWIS